MSFSSPQYRPSSIIQSQYGTQPQLQPFAPSSKYGTQPQLQPFIPSPKYGTQTQLQSFTPSPKYGTQPQLQPFALFQLQPFALSPKYRTQYQQTINIPTNVEQYIERLNLSKDTLRLVALNLDGTDLLNFCLTNKQFNVICKDEIFWRFKLMKDFPYWI